MRSVPSRLPFAFFVAMFGGLILMLLGAYIEGSPLLGFLNLPAFLIVGGGTIGATISTLGWEHFAKIKGGLVNVANAGIPDWEAMVVDLIRAAEIARHPQMGLLRLEQEADAAREEDPFFALALQLLADGTEQHIMVEVLHSASESEHKEIRQEAEIFSKAGGYAPTMGIIGTVMGLTHALTLLNTPSKLGPAIAGAFMATLYGVASGNLFWLPAGNRLYEYGREQASYRELVITGAIAIQRGDQPRVVAEQLAAMVPVELDVDEIRSRARAELPKRDGEA